MKVSLILFCSMTFTISSMHAGFFINLDLNFSGLTSLSESSKKLTKMVEMQKDLDNLPIRILDVNKSSVEKKAELEARRKKYKEEARIARKKESEYTSADRLKAEKVSNSNSHEIKEQ